MRIYVKDEYKNFYKLLEFSNGKYSAISVFRDFVAMYAISIKNMLIYEQDDEDFYLSITKKYNKEELKIFIDLITELIRIYIKKDRIEDVLGEIYSQIQGTYKSLDQFFTPVHVADLMAKITMSKEEIEGKEIITINDSACGSGTLLLAAANLIESYNNNDFSKIFIVGQDIDFTCICMSYIQASFFNIPAKFILGNSLTNECRKVLYTPAYFVNKKIYEKLKNKEYVTLNNEDLITNLNRIIPIIDRAIDENRIKLIFSIMNNKEKNSDSILEELKKLQEAKKRGMEALEKAKKEKKKKEKEKNE